MDKELEDSINMLKNTDISTIENAENIDLLTYSYAVKTVLNYIENSIPKKVVEEKIEELDRIINEAKYGHRNTLIEASIVKSEFKELLEGK